MAANAAAFGPTDMYAVIEVGAPSYTSGAHWWNGTAATLKNRPAPTVTSESSTRISVLDLCMYSLAMSTRLVEPARPYMIEKPYARMPELNAPSRRYFSEIGRASCRERV